MGRRTIVLLAVLLASACDDATPLPEGTCRLSGRVFHEGHPAAATVRLTRFAAVSTLERWTWRMPGYSEAAISDNTQPISKPTDALGAFAFDGLPTGVYEVFATDASGRVARTRLALHLPGERAAVFPKLHASKTLTRRFVWTDKTPATGTVTLTPHGRSGWASSGPHNPWLGAEDQLPEGPPIHGEQDADGRVSFERMPDKHAGYTLEVALSKSLTHRSYFAAHNGLDTVVLPKPTLPIRGRVVNESGSPVVGAKVTARFGDLARVMHTDELGLFEGLVTTPCTCWIEASRGRSGSGLMSMPHLAPLDFVVSGQPPLAGHVVDVDGNPAPGAYVTVTQGHHWFFLNPTAVAIADESGRFEFRDLAFAPTVAFVRGGGWVSLLRADGEPSTSGTRPVPIPNDRRLIAAPSATLRGRVVCPDGTPRPGMQVRALGTLQERQELPDACAGPAVVVADKDGRFTVRDAVPGLVYELVVSGEGIADTSAGRFPLGSKREPFTISVPDARWIRVRVVDRDTKRPVADAFVHLSDGRRHRGTRSPYGTTDGAGWSHLGPVNGPVTVDCTHADYLKSKHHPEVEGSAEATAPEEITIQLQRGRSIAGLVEGGPFPQHQTPRIQARSMDGQYAGFASAEPDGRFIVRGLPQGRYRIESTIDMRGRIKQEVQADAGATDVVIPAPPPKAKGQPLRVEVIDPDGQPVWGSVTVSSGGGAHSSSVREGVATFEIGEDFKPAEAALQILISRACTAQGAALPLGMALRAQVPRDAGTVRIQLQKEQTIEGTLVDDSGRPIAGRAIRAQLKSDDPHLEGTRTWLTPTDKAGHFRISGLMKATYQLSISRRGNMLPSKPVEAEAGARDVRMVIAIGIQVELSILDPEGRPLPNAPINARARGLTRRARTLEDGTATLRGLRPGQTYKLEVYPGDRRDVCVLTIPAWTPSAAETFTLKPGMFIAVRVQDRDGNLVPNAQLRIKTADATMFTSARDGRFKRDRLPGPVTIRAWWPGSSSAFDRAKGIPEVTVKTSNEDIVITLPDRKAAGNDKSK